MKANVSSGRCKVCGQRIAWAQRVGGGWHRPLDVVDASALVIVDAAGYVQEVPAPLFRIHVWSSEDVAAHEAALAEYNATHVEGSSHTLLDVTVACPRCNAEVGERCRPLNPEQYRKANKFNGDHLVTPHKERVALTQGGSDA